MDPVSPSSTRHDNPPPPQQIFSYSSFYLGSPFAFAWSNIDESSVHQVLTFSGYTNERYFTPKSTNDMKAAIMETIGEAWKSYVPLAVHDIPFSASVEELALLEMSSNGAFWYVASK